jgi:hypothetical protein
MQVELPLDTGDTVSQTLRRLLPAPELENLRDCGNVTVAGESVRDTLKCDLAMVPSPTRNYAGKATRIGKRALKINGFL